MKRKIANKILSFALASSMVLTSFVPSYAMEDPVDEGTPIEFLDENEEEEEEEESAAAASSSVEVKEETPLNSGAGDDEDDPENGDGTGEPKVTGEDDILILEEEEKEEEGTDSQKTPSVIKIKYELGEDVQLAEADKEKTSLEGFVGEEMTITLAEPVCDGQIFDGWYTTPEYTDNSFTYADGAWTYTFTPEEEEVSLTFYASFGFGSKLMGTDDDGIIKVNYWIVPDDYGTGVDAEYIARTMPRISQKLLGTYEVDINDPEYTVMVEDVPKPAIPKLNDEDVTFETLMRGFVFVGWSYDMDYDLAGEYHWNSDSMEPEEGFDESRRVEPGKSPIPTNVDVVNIYAHWKSADFTVNVIDPDGHSEFIVGDYALKEDNKFRMDRNLSISTPYIAASDYSDYGYAVIPKKGYWTTGLYTDEACEQEVEETSSSRGYKFYYDIPLSQLWELISVDENDTSKCTITLYAKTEEISNVKLKLYYYNKSGKNTAINGLDASTKILEYLPDSVNNVNGYDFDGWCYYIPYSMREDEDDYGMRHVDQDTTISDLGLDYSEREGGFYTDVFTNWVPTKYTIRFHLNNGENVVKEYSFKEHFADQTLQINRGTGVISGNSSAGEDAEWSNYDADNDQKFLNYLERTSDEFVGWAVEPKGEVVFDRGLTTASVRKYAYDLKKTVIDLYAVWDVAPYNLEVRAFSDEELADISFENEDFSASNYKVTSKEELVHNESIYVKETVILTGSEFVRQGYTLTGWTYKKTVNGETTTKTLKPAATITEKTAVDSAVLTANWKPVEYKVKYNLNGGVVTPKNTKTTVKYSRDTVKDSIPLLGCDDTEGAAKVTKTGYEFEGWTAGGVDHYGGDVYKNLTLTAKWTAKPYTITLDPDGGTIPGSAEGAEKELDAVYNQTVSLKGYTPKKPGYTFKTWKYTNDANKAVNVKANASVKNLTLQDAVTVKAVWTANSNKITYNLNGGALPKLGKKKQSNPAKYATGTSVNLIAPEKAGYTFKEWELSLNGVGAATLSGAKNSVLDAGSYGNITLTAKYDPIHYTIRFNMNLNESDDKLAPGENKIVEGETLYVPNYNFVVSYDNVDYDTVFTFDRMAKQLESKLNAEGAKQLSITGFVSKDGKKKYNLNSNYSKLATGGTVELYAQWSRGESKKTYRVFYDLDGGTISKKTTTYSPFKATKIANPTKTGYVFAGWKIYTIGSDLVAVEANDLDTTVDTKTQALTINKGNTDDINLEATWAPISYKVYIDSVYVGDYDYVDGDNDDFVLSPSKTGYVYGGVWTAKNGKGRRIDEAQTTEDNRLKVTFAADAFEGLSTKNGAKVQLYTYWTADQHTITYVQDAVDEYGSRFYEPDQIRYDENGFSWYDSKEVVIDYTAIVPSSAKVHTYNKDLTLPKISVPGYTFLGWKIAADPESWEIVTDDLGEVKATVSKAKYITKINKNNNTDVKLIPVLRENKYSFKLNLGGGKNIKAFYSGSYRTVTDSRLAYDELVRNLYSNIGNFEKKGYTVRGLYLDAKGKTPLPEDYESYKAVSKNFKGTVQIYVLWDKVTVTKPSKVVATLLDGGILKVQVKDANAASQSYQVEYSTSMLFTKATTKTVIFSNNEGTKEIVNAYGSRYYVRVKAVKTDSTGYNMISSANSSTVRAIR